MKVESGRSAHLRGIQSRMTLRRVAVGSRPGRCRLDALTTTSYPVAIAYRPRLRSDVVLNGDRLERDGLAIVLDETFERRLVGWFDGKRSLGEAAVLAANGLSSAPSKDPIFRAIEIVESLARWDLMETGPQGV